MVVIESTKARPVGRFGYEGPDVHEAEKVWVTETTVQLTRQEKKIWSLLTKQTVAGLDGTRTVRPSPLFLHLLETDERKNSKTQLARRAKKEEQRKRWGDERERERERGRMKEIEVESRFQSEDGERRYGRLWVTEELEAYKERCTTERDSSVGRSISSHSRLRPLRMPDWMARRGEKERDEVKGKERSGGEGKEKKSRCAGWVWGFGNRRGRLLCRADEMGIAERLRCAQLTGYALPGQQQAPSPSKHFCD
jgi:hypothetical protein